MSELACPRCSTVREIETFQLTADEFCTHCDYPLFWAPTSLATASANASSAATLRRLPGTAGRRSIGSRDCPSCGELNPLGETHCLRCDFDFNPAPVVVKQATPPPPRPEPVAKKMRRWPWYMLAVAVVIVAIFLLLRWLEQRYGYDWLGWVRF